MQPLVLRLTLKGSYLRDGPSVSFDVAPNMQRAVHAVRLRDESQRKASAVRVSAAQYIAIQGKCITEHPDGLRAS